MKTKTIGTLGVAAAGLLCSAGLAMATTTDTLADLVANGGSLSIGDKVFSGFSYVGSGLTSFNAAGISVAASQVGAVDYLTWFGNISLLAQSSGTALITGDLELNYVVTATAGTINEIDQNYTGGTSGDGLGQISIAETVTTPGGGGAIVGSTYLNTTYTSEPQVNLNSSQPYINPPQRVLDVTKDISLGAILGPSGGTELVSVSVIQQSFHQTTTTVPDGGMTLSLLGLGLAGCGMLRRKQSK